MKHRIECRSHLPRCSSVVCAGHAGRLPLFGIGRALDGHVTIAMHVRGELLIWRAARARYRLRHRHWRLGRCYREQQARLHPRDTWHRRFISKIKGLIQ